MPSVINPADRRLVLIAGGVFVLLLCSVAFLTPAGGEDAGVVPSTYSSGPGGARAAFLLLRQLGLPVERWENSPVDLPPEGNGAVLILANPTDEPNQAEHDALMRFVQTGGRVLFAGIITGDFFLPAYLRPHSHRTPNLKHSTPSSPAPSRVAPIEFFSAPRRCGVRSTMRSCHFTEIPGTQW